MKTVRFCWNITFTIIITSFLLIGCWFTCTNLVNNSENVYDENFTLITEEEDIFVEVLAVVLMYIVIALFLAILQILIIKRFIHD